MYAQLQSLVLGLIYNIYIKLVTLHNSFPMLLLRYETQE